MNLAQLLAMLTGFGGVAGNLFGGSPVAQDPNARGVVDWGGGPPQVSMYPPQPPPPGQEQVEEAPGGGQVVGGGMSGRLDAINNAMGNRGGNSLMSKPAMMPGGTGNFLSSRPHVMNFLGRMPNYQEGSIENWLSSRPSFGATGRPGGNSLGRKPAMMGGGGGLQSYAPDRGTNQVISRPPWMRPVRRPGKDSATGLYRR